MFWQQRRAFHPGLGQKPVPQIKPLVAVPNLLICIKHRVRPLGQTDRSLEPSSIKQARVRTANVAESQKIALQNKRKQEEEEEANQGEKP